MQKCFYFVCLVIFIGRPGGSVAQTLSTNIGPVLFYNSLDSGKSALLTGIARRCYCLLQLSDSTHSRLLKLDLDLNHSPSDTSFYLLDYNNLPGSYILPDSAGSSMDSLAEAPGIYIKARDSVLRPEIILRLLDYGLHHYSELQERKKAGKPYDMLFVAALMKQKATIAFRRMEGRCK